MRHQTISFVKSAIRLVGYMMLPIDLFWGALILVISEIVGIVEEIGHD